MITRLKGVGVIFALLTVFAGLLFIADNVKLKLYSPQIAFSREGWQESPLRNTKLSARQTMMRDLILNTLPGKTRSEVENVLGESPTKAEMQRRTKDDRAFREVNKDGTSKPTSMTESGYYFDDLDWDAIYIIGYEQVGGLLSSWVYPERRLEMLIVRYDTNNIFSSWYVFGSPLWPDIVGGEWKVSVPGK